MTVKQHVELLQLQHRRRAAMIAVAGPNRWSKQDEAAWQHLSTVAATESVGDRPTSYTSSLCFLGV